MFKRNKVSMKETKKLLQTHELCTKGKFILRRKEKFILRISWIKEKLVLWISGSKTRSFLMQEVVKKIIFP